MGTCPECKADLLGGAPGTVVPCPSCGNPVALPHGLPAHVDGGEPKPARDRAAADPGAQPPPPTLPWMLAAGVLIVLALAHYGLYLLITGPARAELAEIEARQGSKVVRRVTAPGDAPAANSPAYAAWLEKKELYDDVRAWKEHESQRAWVASGLTLAYLVQVGITAWALYQIADSRSRRGRNGRKRDGRQSRA